MYVKLCLRNIQRSAREYWAYGITISLTAALVYAFDLLITSQELSHLSADFETTSALLLIVSAVVAAITMGLVRYATRFMMERRSREFANYLLLGMRKKKVCRLFLIENIGLGFGSFLCGLALGSLLYQIIRSILLNSLLEESYSFSIDFSFSALCLTFLYFFLAYLLALRKSRRRLKKASIYDLMYGGVRREKTVLRRPVLRFLIFLLSFFSLLTGLSGIPEIYQSPDPGLTLVVVLILLITGIYGVHIGIPSFLESLCKLPFIRWKKARLFLLRQITSRAGSNGAMMGTVALLLSISLFCFIIGFGCRFLYPVMEDYICPFDILLDVEAPQIDYQPALHAIEESCGIQQATEYPLYYSGQHAVVDSLGESYYHRFLSDTPDDRCISLSDYNRLRVQVGLAQVSLDNRSYLIHTQFPEYISILEQGAVPLTIAGIPLQRHALYQEGLGQEYGNNGTGFLLVLPDYVCSYLSRWSSCLAVSTSVPPSEELARELYGYPYYSQEGYSVLESSVSLQIRSGGDSSMIGYLSISFAAFYLGIVLLLICATVLSLQQTSGISAQQYRFSLLNRLGVSESQRNRLAFRQLAISFFLPTLVPLFSNLFIFRMVVPLGYERLFFPIAWKSLALTYFLFFLIYICYFIATYLSFQRYIRDAYSG